jgi:hypothetical protein
MDPLLPTILFGTLFHRSVFYSAGQDEIENLSDKVETIFPGLNDDGAI